ncbi:MAG: hypothetical protein QOG87_1760 [Actinomycetota bacterium]
MQAVRWVGLVAGFLIALFTFLSVLRTLIVPRAYTSRLARTVSRSIFNVALVFVRRTTEYERQDRVLALVAPLSLVGLLVVWLSLFLVGYTLMVWPFAGGPIRVPFLEAGSALFTLGFVAGEDTGPSPVLFAAAATGPIIIALQIAYLPTLYAAFNRREVLVTLLETRAGAPAWGPELLARHQLVGIMDSLPDFYADWERWAADVAESHSTYPMLVWFRSAHALQSWVGALLAVMDSAAMYLALAPSRAPSEARLCLRMGYTCLRRIAETVQISYDDDPKPDDPISLTFFEFEQGVTHLERVGFPMERGAEDAWPHFHGWRVNYEMLSYALADRTVAPPALWSGERRHLAGPPIPPWRPPHRAPDDESEQA